MAIGRISVVRRFLLEPRSQSRHAAGPEPAGPAGAKLDAWGAWQRDQAGISEGVLRNRRGWAGGFVAVLADGDAVRWEDAGVAMVNAYIVERGRGYAPASCSLLVSAMRSLLRWALATGRIDRDLSRGILRPRATSATPPRGLTPGQVDALLAAASTATRVGVRDRVVVITLSRLGLRAGEAAGLTLDDIDWAAGRLTVTGKGHPRALLPTATTRATPFIYSQTDLDALIGACPARLSDSRAAALTLARTLAGRVAPCRLGATLHERRLPDRRSTTAPNM